MSFFDIGSTPLDNTSSNDVQQSFLHGMQGAEEAARQASSERATDARQASSQEASSTLQTSLEDKRIEAERLRNLTTLAHYAGQEKIASDRIAAGSAKDFTRNSLANAKYVYQNKERDNNAILNNYEKHTNTADYSNEYNAFIPGIRKAVNDAATQYGLLTGNVKDGDGVDMEALGRINDGVANFVGSTANPDVRKALADKNALSEARMRMTDAETQLHIQKWKDSLANGGVKLDPKAANAQNQYEKTIGMRNHLQELKSNQEAVVRNAVTAAGGTYSDKSLQNDPTYQGITGALNKTDTQLAGDYAVLKNYATTGAYGQDFKDDFQAAETAAGASTPPYTIAGAYNIFSTYGGQAAQSGIAPKFKTDANHFTSVVTGQPLFGKAGPAFDAEQALQQSPALQSAAAPLGGSPDGTAPATTPPAGSTSQTPEQQVGASNWLPSPIMEPSDQSFGLDNIPGFLH